MCNFLVADAPTTICFCTHLFLTATIAGICGDDNAMRAPTVVPPIVMMLVVAVVMSTVIRSSPYVYAMYDSSDDDDASKHGVD